MSRKSKSSSISPQKKNQTSSPSSGVNGIELELVTTVECLKGEYDIVVNDRDGSFTFMPKNLNHPPATTSIYVFVEKERENA